MSGNEDGLTPYQHNAVEGSAGDYRMPLGAAVVGAVLGFVALVLQKAFVPAGGMDFSLLIIYAVICSRPTALFGALLGFAIWWGKSRANVLGPFCVGWLLGSPVGKAVSRPLIAGALAAEAPKALRIASALEAYERKHGLPPTDMTQLELDPWDRHSVFLGSRTPIELNPGTDAIPDACVYAHPGSFNRFCEMCLLSGKVEDPDWFCWLGPF